MTKRAHKSFRELNADIHGLAPPSAPERIDQITAGNRQVLREAREPTVSAPRKRGGRTGAHKQLTKQNLPLHGVSPAIRQDKVSRRASGGRNKYKGANHVIIAMLPHHGMAGAPVAQSDGNVSRRSPDGRGEHEYERHAASGGASFASGGAAGAVSRGESLADVRRRTARD
jgi:hypothetical protein